MRDGSRVLSSRQGMLEFGGCRGAGTTGSTNREESLSLVFQMTAFLSSESINYALEDATTLAIYLFIELYSSAYSKSYIINVKL